jgi:hypothetical protein
MTHRAVFFVPHRFAIILGRIDRDPETAMIRTQRELRPAQPNGETGARQ